MQGIYQITVRRPKQAPLVYVGSSKDIERRWGEHRRELRRGTHVNVYLQRAYTKYGEAAFEWAVLEVVTGDEAALLAAEERWIARLVDARGRASVMNLSAVTGSAFNDPAVVRRRNANPEWRSNVSAAATATFAKTHPGFVSPSGEVYEEVHNLRAFCRANELDPGAMWKLAHGRIQHFHGWRRYTREGSNGSA